MNEETRERLKQLIQTDFNKIDNNDAQLVIADPELEQLAYEAYKNNPNFPLFEQEVIFMHFGFRREFIEKVFETVKAQGEIEYLEMLFDSESHQGIVQEYEQYAHDYDLSAILDSLRDKEFEGVINRISNIELTDMKFDYPPLIDFVIENGLYIYASQINIKENVPPKVEQFILTALDNFTFYKKLNTVTPRIKNAVINKKLYQSFLSVLDLDSDHDIEILVDNIGDDKVSFWNIHLYNHPKLRTHPKMLLERIKNDDMLYPEDIQVIKDNPRLILELKKYIVREVNTEYRCRYYFSSGFDQIPEIVLSYLDNIIDEKEYDNFLTKIIGNETILHNTYHYNNKAFINALLSYLRKGGKNYSNILKCIEYETSSLIKYPEILKALITNIKIEDISKIFVNNYTSYNRSKELEEIIEEILKENADFGFYFEPPIPNFQTNEFSSLGPYTKNAILRSLPVETLPYFVRLYDVTTIEDTELRNRLLITIFTRLAEGHSEAFANEYSWLSNISLPKEVIDIITRPDNPLNIRFRDLNNILGAKNSNAEMYRDFADKLEELQPSDISDLINRMHQSDDEDLKPYIELFKKLLYSPKLKLNNEDEVNNMVINILSAFSFNAWSHEDENEIKNTFIEFVKTLHILRPSTIQRFDNEDLIFELIDNIDESYYTGSMAFFENINDARIRFQLSDILKDRLDNNKPVKLDLLMKYTNLKISDFVKPNVQVNFDNNERIIFDIFMSRDLNDDFIEKIIIPNINTYFIMNPNVKFQRFFPNHVHSLVARLFEMLEDNPTMPFNDNILNILPAANGIKAPISQEIQRLFDKIMPNIVSMYNPQIIDIDDPIVNTYVINLIKKESLGNLIRYADSLIKYPIYTEPLINKIKATQYVSTDVLCSALYRHQDLKPVLLEAIREGRIRFTNINNSNLLDPDILEAAYQNNPNNIKWFITYIIHFPSNTSWGDTIKILNKYIPEVYELDKEKYDLLVSIVGANNIVLLIEDTNFSKLFEYTLDELQAFAELVKFRPMNLNILNDINNSLATKVYDYENPEVLNIYVRTVARIQNGITEEEKDEIINMFINIKPDAMIKILQKHEDKHLLELYQRDQYEFLSYLIDMLAENQNDYSDIFALITTGYIIEERNKFLSTDGSIAKLTEAYYEPEKKSLYDNFFNYLLTNNPNKLLQVFRKQSFTQASLYSWGINVDTNTSHPISKEEYLLIKDIIGYLRNPGDYENIDKERLLQIKKNIRRIKVNFHELCKESSVFSALPPDFEFLLEDEKFMKGVKQEIVIPQKEKSFKELLSNLNLNTLFDYIINDKEKYNTLLEIVKKYHIFSWGTLFTKSLDRLTSGYEVDDLYNFLNAFNQIYDQEKATFEETKKNMIEAAIRRGAKQEEIEKIKNMTLSSYITPYKIYKYTTIYSSISSCYKLILGPEDAEFIRRNENPNAATRTVEERLEKTTKMMLQMQELDEVTIPSFISEYSLDDHPKLRVIVGNRANPRNLTHGERTGACMRAYGLANALFEFCALDPRGFHITFVDPETNEYVSRVSGFRNGNTICLNQLRYSKSPYYTTDDVINACREVAQELIERSKDSEMPIENVIASPCYALQGQETKMMSSYDIRGGVYEGYLDVSCNAVVLATTGKDGEPVEIKPDADNQPIYQPVRLYPEMYTGIIPLNVLMRLQRITAIKDCLEHKEEPEYYKTIDIDIQKLEKEYEYVIIGQDWYVTLDKEQELSYDFIPGDERAKEEIQEALAKIDNLKSTKKAGNLHV